MFYRDMIEKKRKVLITCKRRHRVVSQTRSERNFASERKSFVALDRPEPWMRVAKRCKREKEKKKRNMPNFIATATPAKNPPCNTSHIRPTTFRAFVRATRNSIPRRGIKTINLQVPHNELDMLRPWKCKRRPQILRIRSRFPRLPSILRKTRE